jgi:hypothetical protein
MYLHGSEERVDTALHHLLNSAGPSIAGITRESHPQAVAVHDPAHLWRRNEYAVFQPFDAEEAVAGAIGADCAFDGAAGAGADGVLGGAATAIVATSAARAAAIAVVATTAASSAAVAVITAAAASAATITVVATAAANATAGRRFGAASWATALCT